jgi:hypothetical protein
MSDVLADIIGALNALPEKERDEVVREVCEATEKLTFIPSPGPQTKAYFSEADILLYGGEPGGGKTALGVGLSLNEHTRALLVRKNFVDLDGVLHALDNIVGKPNCAKGGNRPYYETPDGRLLDFMGLGDNIDGKQGNPHDLIYVDEAAQIPEQSFRMIMGWLRTSVEGQRCRAVLGSNPPLDSTGDWLIDYFAPWLDDRHPNPAADGELRWFLPNENDDGYHECEPGDTIVLHGLEVKAHSRTFIRSKVTDNPYLDPAEYSKALSNLPKEMRDRLMSGNFMSAREDPPWQAIPTAWVKAAQERWRESPPPGVPQCSMGVDVAQGGADKTVISRRYDWWFAQLITEEGKNTPGGTDVAALVIKHRHDGSKVIIDVGGGWGASAHGHLMKNQVDSMPYMGVKESKRRTADNQLSFVNIRTEAYWRLREALDPDQLGGSQLALPPDRVLMSDLTSPSYRITSKGIELEPKAKLVERLKRSTDKGDAVVMAWYAGAKASTDWHSWPASQQSWRSGRPQVNLGHAAARRKR